jgi:hypothetical protein
MAFDLHAALLKKREVERTGLDDFAFRVRARTMRLQAAAPGEDAAVLVRLIATDRDTSILATLSARHPPAAVGSACRHARTTARTALVAERRDPAGQRLA